MLSGCGPPNRLIQVFLGIIHVRCITVVPITRWKLLILGIVPVLTGLILVKVMVPDLKVTVPVLISLIIVISPVLTTIILATIDPRAIVVVLVCSV